MTIIMAVLVGVLSLAGVGALVWVYFRLPRLDAPKEIPKSLHENRVAAILVTNVMAVMTGGALLVVSQLLLGGGFWLVRSGAWLMDEDGVLDPLTAKQQLTLAAATAVIPALGMLAIYVIGYLHIWPLAELKDAKRKEERRGYRESVRQFAEFLEDKYSWVLEMSKDQQELRALLWYDEIVTKWEEENAQYQKLRASDERDLVAQELGPLADRMLKIWEARRRLYQFAYAYSTKDKRAREIVEIEHRIAQMKSEVGTRAVEYERRKQDTERLA